MPASLAFLTAPIEASAPALSRMIALALREIALSISSLCLFGSSSCEAAEVSYPSSLALATAASASDLKNGLSAAGVMTAIRPPPLALDAPDAGVDFAAVPESSDPQAPTVMAAAARAATNTPRVGWNCIEILLLCVF